MKKPKYLVLEYVSVVPRICPHSHVKHLIIEGGYVEKVKDIDKLIKYLNKVKVWLKNEKI
jgi:hypothetical protein